MEKVKIVIIDGDERVKDYLPSLEKEEELEV